MNELLQEKPTVCARLTWIMAGAVCLIGTGAARAQEARPAGDQAAGLDEIIVTAQFREEKLQETPIAITAVTDVEIQARSFTESYEIGYTVPNASFRPAQAAYGNTMTAYIRGVGQNDFDQAFEPGVGIYVDDVYQPFTLGTQMDLLDMDRVEVLRGPQGTLFGRGSIGGVMRLVSKRPEGSNTGDIQLTAGSFDRVDVRASYDFAMTDNVFARFTGVSRHSTGYQKVFDFACEFQDDPAMIGELQIRDPSRGRHCQTGTQGGVDVTGLRGQLRWVINDNVELSFSADYESDTSEAKADTLLAVIYPTDLSGNTIPTSSYMLWNTEYAQHVPSAAEPWGWGVAYDERFIPSNIYKTYATYDDPASGLTFKPESGLEKSAYSAKLDWKLSDTMSLTAILAYSDLTGQLTSDADASPLNLQVTGGQQDFDWSTAEVRLNGRAADKVNWTAGLFYYESTAANRQAVSFPPILWGVFRNSVGLPPAVAASIIDAPGNVSVNAQNIADSKSEAAFIHTVTDLTDKLSMTLGVRYSKDTKDVAFDNSFFVGPINLDDDHFDWRAGLDYQISDDVMIYGSAATGYRPGAYNPRPFTAAQALPVDGEEMTAYELGVKADLFDRRLRVNAALFYSDYDKRIVPIGGTECVPPLVDPSTPGAIIDSAGNVCLATTSLTSYQQLRGAKIQGAELEINWRPLDALAIDATYGFTDWSSPDIDNCDFNQDGAPDVGITCSDRPNFVPKNNWSASIAYDFGLGSGAKVTPRADVYGQSEICSSVVSANSCAEGYELVNVRLQWTSAEGEWLAAVGGTNVTDEEYFYNIFDLTTFGQNTVEGQPGPPRQWYFEVSRRF
ncbi:MAG TPA: TonB-dependent receptor [Steroidobacteraceae bacterium]|nr:TonB-dependent receptor [Steroidobacteraceae bacterium]